MALQHRPSHPDRSATRQHADGEHSKTIRKRAQIQSQRQGVFSFPSLEHSSQEIGKMLFDDDFSACASPFFYPCLRLFFVQDLPLFLPQGCRRLAQPMGEKAADPRLATSIDHQHRGDHFPDHLGLAL